MAKCIEHVLSNVSRNIKIMSLMIRLTLDLDALSITMNTKRSSHTTISSTISTRPETTMIKFFGDEFSTGLGP